MATPTVIPVAGLVAFSNAIASGLKTEINANLDLILALIPNTTHPTAQTTPPSGVSPLYDKWPPELALAMRTEITALKTAVSAAP